MLLPKGGLNWKAAKANLPPSRAVIVFLTRTRFLLAIAVVSIILLLWRGIRSSASEMQRWVSLLSPFSCLYVFFVLDEIDETIAGSEATI